MALVLADRVRETTTTAGSGTITLAGAEPGYQSFSAVGDGNQTYYVIAGDTEWEVGIGTYTASGTTLSRDTVLSSSASGAKVTFSAGSKRVFVSYPSEKSVNLDISGNISLSSAVISGVAYPTVNSDAATKLYVDTMVASGITYHEPVKYEVPNSTGNLVATYNNGTAGVSATLTNAGSLVPFIPDGVTASISDRVIVYNQTNAYENGVYTVTVVGDGSTAWVLTRATDADTYGVKSPTSLGQGDAFFVTSGDTGAGETYVCNNSGVISFGSTAISFVQISSAQVYKAGNGISLTNTTISLVSPVAVANGGTGTTATPTNGQLLIGNGTGYALSTLTAGSGVSITNSAGSITLSATGLGGTVTAVTATGPLASSGGTTPDISIANSTGTGSVVLQSDAVIYSATITAATSASITTITGSSANITTVTGTTAGFSSAAITQLSGTSAGITTVSGTTTTFSSGTITQFGATSATITTLSGTNVSYPNASFTSASITNLALTSLTLGNLSIASANITTLTGTNLSYASATITTGNLTFSSTGQRITGDMSNATIANRLAFQTSTTNGATQIVTLPNGTGSTSGLLAYGGSDPANTNLAALVCVGGGFPEARVASNFNGTGTACPITFYISGSERMRLDTSGNLGIGGTAAAGTKVNALGTLPSSGTNTTAFGADGTIPSTTTNLYSGFTSGATTEATAFTLSAYQHFRAAQTAFGAGSTVTNQQGFFAASSLTGATNNYGFFGNLNAVGNSWNFYAAGSAPNYFAGNVAIGTTSTGFNAAGLPLVVGSGSGNTGMTIYSGTAGIGSIHFGDTVTTGGDSYSGYLNYNHSTNSMQFGTNATERMRIGSTGDIQVGSAANPGNTLRYFDIYNANTGASAGSIIRLITSDVAGTGLSTFDVVKYKIGAVVLANNETNAAAYTAFNVGSSERMRITSAGNVGIGTASPGTKLHLYGAGTTSTAYTNGDAAGATLYLQDSGASAGNGGQILFGSAFGISAGIKMYVTNGTGPAGDLLFQIRSTSGNVVERMRLLASGGFSVGTTADPGAGAIYATGNITAYYSDARLKDFKGKIDGALDKVSQLNGYYYTENAKAEEFGYNNKAMQVGVSAQEVKAVLPEVVSAAPFDLDRDGNSKSGENYMTVNYEKLVPLLIEAIKELKAEVEALKAAK